jgi:polysaccharide pyruvyl transferase WcaK-like protein
VKTFLLAGIGGVYNYGCEAIVRGTELVLRERWPDARILYASCRAEDDRRRLAGANVEVVPRTPLGRLSRVRLARKALALAGVRWVPADPRPDMLRGVDAVLSIGGDIYTLGNGGAYSEALPKFGDAAEGRGVPYVLWGASVGPFDVNPTAERFFRNHISRISLVAARERRTVEYLAGFTPSTRTIRCADPAFTVAPEIIGCERAGAGLTIGINLSPLSLRYTGLPTEESARLQGEMIWRIASRFSAKVLLIPHVVCDFHEDDDDLRYLRLVHRNVPEAIRSQVALLDADPGFVGVKQVLTQCDVVVAARMHCAINAMASHVPALLLAYSAKAPGMAEYVYGHSRWVLPVNDFCSEASLKLLAEFLGERAAVREALGQRMPSIQADARNALDALARLVDGKAPR